MWHIPGEEGQVAYGLAVAAVDLVSRDHDEQAAREETLSLEERTESLSPGGSLKFHYEGPSQVYVDAVLERRVGDFTWHVRVENALRSRVLDVVFSTALTASECEVMVFSRGDWEYRLVGSR